MPTIGQVEEQIYACEGFRVRLTPFKAATKTLPPYDFLVMAPQRWRISDWKTVRLGSFVPLVRDIVVLRGDDKPAKTDIMLGHLRDTYYQARYGSLAAEGTGLPAITTLTVVPAAAEPAPPKRPASRPRKR